MSDAASWIFLVGRVVFGAFFVAVAGWGHLTRGTMMVGYAKATGFPAPFLASWPAGLWLVAGGLSVALGIWPDIGALMLGIFVVPAALWFHRFWAVEDPDQKQAQTMLFYRNVIIFGTALMLFAVFTSVGHGLELTVTDPVFDLRP